MSPQLLQQLIIQLCQTANFSAVHFNSSFTTNSEKDGISRRYSSSVYVRKPQFRCPPRWSHCLKFPLCTDSFESYIEPISMRLIRGEEGVSGRADIQLYSVQLL